LNKALILEFQGKSPTIAPDAFIALGAVVIGPGANIWFGAVLRGDLNHIDIGARASIQDNCVLHCNYPTIVGANVVMEGCTIGDGSLIGMNATVLTLMAEGIKHYTNIMQFYENGL
jgi:carbonic anhydrase/acetyltransferase-like protein (isoleucine patch superfamily)